jgi:ParB-like chromosome segregation protein Spo0J
MQDPNQQYRLLREVKLAPGEITADSNFQPRIGGIDPEHVAELEPVSEHWPPLKVVQRGDRYLLVDGFHRLAAAQKRGLERVTVSLLEVPESEDLHALAFTLNAIHGSPLTLSDRRAFAGRLLRGHPDWSDREIGRRSGLVQPTVAKVRHDLEQQAQIPVTTARVGRDGRPYDATPQQRHKKITVSEFLENIVSRLDQNEQRRIVRYLEKLADLLEEQDTLEGFQTIKDAATACCAILGEEKSKELAERLGWSSGNIFEIARALGHRPEAQS